MKHQTLTILLLLFLVICSSMKPYKSKKANKQNNNKTIQCYGNLRTGGILDSCIYIKENGDVIKTYLLKGIGNNFHELYTPYIVDDCLLMLYYFKYKGVLTLGGLSLGSTNLKKLDCGIEQTFKIW